ncbi:MAG: hypothetical protein LBR16_09490 [Treponema sp.]|jgi:hypothetical protein|nr:hypothetical protein [Treponema sp.]
MKRFIFCVLIAALLSAALGAIEVGNGFSIGGGVKSGLMMKNSDYAGKLEGIARSKEKPLTLYFASSENEAYKGEGWLSFNYDSAIWGVGLSFWSHGDLDSFNDALHLGDHYLWAKFLNNRLQFFGGQGGGTPIATGGWLNADWLSYTGLRVFYVDPVGEGDPLGLSFGLNFPDPREGSDEKEIKPVNYLAKLMYGGQVKYNNFSAAIMFANTPIYDDSESNYDGGLHRPDDQDPIAMKGNIGLGIGVDKIYGGYGALNFDAIFSNLGADDKEGMGFIAYKLSPIEMVFAIKTSIGDLPAAKGLYADFKLKYHSKTGENSTLDGPSTWGKLEIEPYCSYDIPVPGIEDANLKFDFSLNLTSYINSYYLAEDLPGYNLSAGWAPAYPPAYDYYSTYQLTVEPGIAFHWKGAEMKLGYKGEFSGDSSRGHLVNKAYVDFRWAF